MDAESDEYDERWEDFYGSSTELTPTLLSIYDALNTSFETNFKTNSNNEVKCKIQSTYQNSPEQSNDLCNTFKNDKNFFNEPKNPIPYRMPNLQAQRPSCCIKKVEGNSIPKLRSNIKLLSPNVQRIIAHADADHIDTVNIENHQHQPNEDDTAAAVHSASLTSVQHLKRKTHTTLSSHHAHKGKLSLIPLSKGAEKLTMTGNELVSTFDSSSEYLDSSQIFAQNHQTPFSPPLKHISSNEDDEKTPTNTNKPFNFNSLNHQPKENNGFLKYIDLLEMKKLETTTQLLTTLSISTPNSIHCQNEDNVAPCHKEISSPLDRKNESIINKIQVQAINTSLVNKKSIAFNSNKTISRSQSLAHPRSTNNDLSATTKQPTSKSFSTLKEHENASTESLDLLSELKLKISSREPQKTAAILLPEIAKLKHRPLSSSSLCSTTSSSSSGSDNLNTKLSTSYLASVESLADHSESELNEQHTNMSVLDRSCLEIVDSERNYVEDLRQVITGYLCDWRERACLRTDELKILFSNIEEIYEFSSLLLKHLADASMDSVRIAKCFIALRENFSVYTKYCTSYPEAISLLTKLLQATHTNSLLTSTQKMLQHTLPLGSYLLKPVQRILKYHLLLENLRKHCDFKEVFQAYEIMRQVARNIDQVKRRLEQQSRVKELSGILDGWLGPELTVLGELRLEGLLLDHNKPRKVFLFTTMLIITKPKEDNRLQFKSYITQNNLMLSEHLPGEPTSFYVIPYDEPRNQIKLTAKNRDQKRVWTQHIKEAMLEKFDNIPNRAKELVYKLGDEEDRTSGKNSWKWTMNSTSMTPVYLERRNQYRRSEMRNRFKLKRKSISDLSFNQNSNTSKEQLADEESPKRTKQLARKNSLDDSMVPMLLRFAIAVRQKRQRENENGNGETELSQKLLSNDLCTGGQHDHRSVEEKHCNCIFSDGPKLKERSKSVPRINIQIDDKEAKNPSAKSGQINLSKSMEIKQYNHKTMPKRVATIKKQRNCMHKRDTFKFYMDISEFEKSDESSTILKITESTENLSKNTDDGDGGEPLKLALEHKNDEPEEEQSKEICNTKKDAQIIFDLLKDNKEFERIYKKPHRSRPTEAYRPENQADDVESFDKPPPPPSSSPPLLEVERSENSSTKNNFEEHIYETLLRNVHAPYKFSPDFKRSKSLQHRTRSNRCSLAIRPESDYVLLKFTDDRTIESSIKSNSDENNVEEKTNSEVEEVGELAKKHRSEPEALQQDYDDNYKNPIDSQPSLEVKKEKDLSYLDPRPKGFVKRLFIAKNGQNCISSLENISNALISRNGRRKSTENNRRCSSSSSNRPPERRASDVSEMCRIAMLHRQGSEAVGERMAYLDYADPRTLFNVASTSLQQLQRDSFFSLTSSSDSVCRTKNSNSELSRNFEYEDDVEDNLERDFRDSAIYSDDNEKRIDFELVETAEDDFGQDGAHGPKMTHQKPKLAPKPPRLKTPTKPLHSPILCPPHMSPRASRSWVLQQIENFSK